MIKIINYLHRDKIKTYLIFYLIKKLDDLGFQWIKKFKLDDHMDLI